MTRVSTKPESAQPQSETAGHLFDNWIDPLETEIRGRVRVPHRSGRALPPRSHGRQPHWRLRCGAGPLMAGATNPGSAHRGPHSSRRQRNNWLG
jgi:hypothetical protein